MKRIRLESVTESGVLSRNGYIFESKTCSDVSFLVGGDKEEFPEIISAHKCILASVCLVFDWLFNEDFMESRKLGYLDIPIPNVTPSTFREVLKWMYTDEYDLSLDSVSPLLSVEKYDLASL
uniref:BTB/POZ domaincontaining protein 3 [Ceratitis capitata] n=1 Tax=Lepeophtheirus salmonis TaxID=72036 RepID=A0A0K2T2K5_LEPSM